MRPDMKLLFLILCVKCVFSINPYKKINTRPIVGNDYGNPVFLTEYLNKHDIEGAKKASYVEPMIGNVESYSGYFTVNKEYNSNIFFWFFPAEMYKEHAPVVVWLQGGPGASSMFGLFSESGPLKLETNGTLVLRKYRWSRFANMIYIDNPVGTGFSFTQNENGYSTDETMVGNNLDNAMRQFFQVFTKYKTNEFYVTGESYGGKYVPAMAYAIHTNNKKEDKINLKGIAIGNGLCDPINMLDYGNYLYQIGIIDTNTKEKFENIQNQVATLIKNEEYLQAFTTFDSLLNGDLTPYKTLFYNATGFTFYFNYLNTKDNSEDGDLGTFLAQSYVRKNIHVGNLTFNDGQKVEKYLAQDVMKSIKPWFQVLINNYRVLVYNGQLDIIVAYPLTVNFIKSVQWDGSDEYKKAPRKKWFVDGQLAGYSKTVRGFTEVLVRNAGHMVPQDQPVWAYDLLKRFVYNKPI